MILGFIGSTELLLIGGIALLLFGGKKLPEMMRGLGKGVREFKDGMKEVNPMNPDDASPEENPASAPEGKPADSPAETDKEGNSERRPDA